GVPSPTSAYSIGPAAVSAISLRPSSAARAARMSASTINQTMSPATTRTPRIARSTRPSGRIVVTLLGVAVRFIRGRPPCLERGQPGCPVTGSAIRDRSGRLSTTRTAMTTPPYTVDPLISAKAIAARIEALSREIAAHYHDTDKLVVVGLLRGSFVFIADLVRELHLPVEVDFIEVSSYGNSTESSREV